MKFVIVCFLMFIFGCSAKNISVKLIAEIREIRSSITATGFLVEDSKGKVHLITVAHFCEAALATGSFIQLEYLDGDKYTAIAGKYVVRKIANGVDLCELAAFERANHHLKVLSLATDWRAKEPVTIDGSPWGYYPAVARGFLIGQQNGYLFGSGLVLPGNSGSPVVNSSGDVVGILAVGGGHIFGMVPFWEIEAFLNE